MRAAADVRLAPASTPNPMPLTIVKLAWRHLPLLVAMDALLALSSVPVLALLVSGGAVLAPLIAALLVAPVWAGSVATTDALVGGGEASLRILVGNIAKHAVTGTAVTFAPAVIVAMAIGTLGLFAQMPGQLWLLPSLFVDGCAVTLVILAQPSLFSVATATRLRGVALWKTALAVTAAEPRTILPLPALAALAWLVICLSGGPGVLLFFPALLALFFSAMTARAIPRLIDVRTGA